MPKKQQTSKTEKKTDWYKKYINWAHSNKLLALVLLIAAIVAGVFGFIVVINNGVQAFNALFPIVKIDVQLYGGNVTTEIEGNKYVGLDVYMPLQIINNGNTQIHIVACDTFRVVNGTPIDILPTTFPHHSTALKPQETMPYELKKHIDVSLPIESTPPTDLALYKIAVFYYQTDPMRVEYVWVETPLDQFIVK